MTKKMPGLLLALVMAAVAILLGQWIPLIGSSIFAIVLGILANQFFSLPAVVRPGLQFSAKKNLQYAIILLGFSLSIRQVSQVGISSLRISLITIALAFLSAYFLGRKLGMGKVLTLLIGFGTAICGGSAIAAASPILEAEDEDIALSISTIFFFNILAVFLFPFLGHLFQMSTETFGTWAGTAINDTSSVVAAGYTYSQQAGDLATIVKLTRALMIVPVCLLFAFFRFRREMGKNQQVQLKKIFPWFILWFVLASAVSSLGLLPASWIGFAKILSQWLMAMALVGIGSQVSFAQFKRAGAAPLWTGAFAWMTVAVSSLVIQYFF